MLLGMTDAKLVEAIGADSHVAVFYDDEAQYWRLLAIYYRSGLERNELGVLVTQTPPAEAVAKLRAAGFKDVERYVMESRLRIFDMIATYLPNGRFVADYMLGNVVSFIEDARAQGFSGIRTAGVMDWLSRSSRPYTMKPKFMKVASTTSSVTRFISPDYVCMPPWGPIRQPSKASLAPTQNIFITTLCTKTATIYWPPSANSKTSSRRRGRVLRVWFRRAGL